jgi:HD-GYP domain-containing protein (c-di-GMP phosphodiesterase class II)
MPSRLSTALSLDRFPGSPMSTATIAVEDLKVGMFVMLDGGWLSHPFPLSNFKISTAEQLATIRGLKFQRVRWSPEKSDLDEPAAEADAGAASAPAAAGAGTDATTAAPALSPEAARQRRALQAQLEASQRCERQHGEAARAWREATELVMARPKDAAQQSELLTRALLDKMLVDDDIGIRLVAGGGDRAASHALNVGVISLLIGRQLGLVEAELMELGVGALMHDVGKLEVADRFRHAEEGFNANELAAYRDHVAKGVAVGQRMGLAAGALRVLAQHHEHADGSGFPLKLGGERITMAARIVALINRYDNLCNPQARTLGLTPHEAVSVLFAQGRNRFDAGVLNVFIRMMGVYPAGSLVQLTDDRFGLVVGVNSSRPLKPRVLVHDPKVPRHEAVLLDLETTPNLGIRRSLPAAKLPPAAIEYLDPRPRVSYYFEPLLREGAAAGDKGSDQPEELAA